MYTAHTDDPAIEALRGCAAMLVVLTHYLHFLTSEPGLWAFASTGVDLFFVISGFVFAPYLAGRPLQLASFFTRRLFRMYPLYLCALLVYVALKPAGADAWAHFPSHLVMAHTLQSVAIASYYNPAFWSLPPEMEFYLLLSLVWRFFWRARWPHTYCWWPWQTRLILALRHEPLPPFMSLAC